MNCDKLSSDLIAKLNEARSEERILVLMQIAPPITDENRALLRQYGVLIRRDTIKMPVVMSKPSWVLFEQIDELSECDWIQKISIDSSSKSKFRPSTVYDDEYDDDIFDDAAGETPLEYQSPSLTINKKYRKEMPWSSTKIKTSKKKWIPPEDDDRIN